MFIDYSKQEAVDFFIKNAWLLKEKVWTKFVSESLTITLRVSLELKLSGLYSNLFVIIFSLIFQKNFGGWGETEKSPMVNWKDKNWTFIYLFLNFAKRNYVDLQREWWPRVQRGNFITERWDSAESLQAAELPCSVSNGPRIYKYWKPQQVEGRFTKQNTKIYYNGQKNWRSRYAATWGGLS